jgi:hypothetical protein
VLFNSLDEQGFCARSMEHATTAVPPGAERKWIMQKWYYRQQLGDAKAPDPGGAGSDGGDWSSGDEDGEAAGEHAEGPRPPTVYCDDTEGCITNSDFDERRTHTWAWAGAASGTGAQRGG